MKRISARTCGGMERGAAVLVLCAGLAIGVLGGARATLGQETVASGAGEPAAARGGAPRVDPGDVPIRRITLYRSGVGYFERRGAIDGSGELQLRYSTEQINDILKSMVLLDLGGGRIESVSYGSKEPLSKRLASFGIDISDNPSAGEILQRLRGTVVSLTTPDGPVAGTIMNVEQRATVIPGSGSTPATVTNLPWINVVTEKGVRSVNLTTVSGFEILDGALAEELNKALSALAEYRADRTKTVDLRFTGTGRREVMVGYVHEMPVWKTSYRLVLPEVDAEEGTGSADKPKGMMMLQGWAIVENTTDQDWNNVRLGLVSGRPVSFQMDLYEPLYSARPMVPVPTIPGVAPRIFGLGIDTEELAERLAAGRSEEGILSNKMQAQRMMPPTAAPAGSGARRDASEADAAYGGFQTKRTLTADDFARYSAQAAATAGSVGEVFQFQVDAPVSIERQRSAMIPILTASVPGRRVSIFNKNDGSGYPMRGVEIVNDSASQLLPGPISVFDGSAYAGDAQIGQIPKGDKRFLAYALDLDVPVNVKEDQSASVMRLTIVDGFVRQQVKDRRTSAYEVSNRDKSRGRTVVLEHAKIPGFELVDTDKPGEQTPDLYRFTVPLTPGKTGTFTVTMEQVRFDSLQVVGFDLTTAIGYHKNGKMSAAVLEAFKAVAAKQAAINEAQRDVDRAVARMSEIDREQARIRQNMGTIDRASKLYADYMSELAQQEGQLKELRSARDAAQAKKDQLAAEFNEFLRTLNVE